jgi:hypothetical protein
MDLHPESRDLAALERLRRRHLRGVWLFGIALAIVMALGFWRKFGPDHDEAGGLATLRAMSGPVIALTGPITFLFFLATALSHGRVVRKIAETRSVQAAMAAHHDLPPPAIARMAAKAWHWRALCLSGAVMMASSTAMAALVYFPAPGYHPAQDIIAYLALPVMILWSSLRFVLAALHFIRFARSEQQP